MNVTERFLKYVSFDTNSNPDNENCPSSPNQLKLADAIVQEMIEIGISDARVDEHGYVYGVIPATEGHESDDSIGMIAHMDTSPSISGANIKPRMIEQYQGGDIVLNQEKDIVLKVSEFESLNNYHGQDLIVTDGTTLLGADDKAGIAEILSAAEKLIESKAPHGKICIGFTPDEEIGRGANLFDVEGFGAKYAYTVDGGPLGELEFENFNAASAKVTIHGVNIHPGSAKCKMVNSLLICMEFQAMLPTFENPAFTEGYEGFSHLTSMSGNEELTVMEYIIRDHDRAKYEEKKDRFAKIAAFLSDKYPTAAIELQVDDRYFNMKEKVEPHKEIIARAARAMESVGAVVVNNPIRGGTDGARLSFKGLPCPNLSTGGHNFHGRYEYISVQSMEKMVDVILHIMTAHE